ncbi:nucleotide exchange factor GrpE [Halogeometricum borinquense]|uniref:nucleotide exchange factor GrpE n=1 Tax=Halogeometricum borinquense TaxID=60847 RepID=UPI00344769DC
MTDESPDGRVSESADADETTDPDVDGSDTTADATAAAEQNGEAEAAETETAAETEAEAETVETETAEAEAVGDAENAETTGDVAARVAEYDDELADEVAALERRVQKLETKLTTKAEEADELTERLKRTQADFQNYKKRAKKRQDQIRETATEDFVERVVTVRDNLLRALDQDEDADIRPGIESTLEEFDRILADEDVSTIDPEPGEEVDPTRHEVMMRVESDQPEGTVADVYQPGYEMAEKVIREAQITVSKDDE